MTGIPYVERRRQKLYLRVRIPADIAPLAGRKFFTKSLQTADPRTARAEAARLLAHLHRTWQAARSGEASDDVRKPEIKSLAVCRGTPETPDELEQMDEQRARWRLERNVPRIAAGEIDVDEILDAHRRMETSKALREHRVATSAALKLAAELAETIRSTTTLPQGQAAVSAASSALPADAQRPWSDLIDRFFADRPSLGASAATSYRQAFKEFEALIGPKALAAVTKANVKAFADHLRDRPINRAGRRAMSRASIVKMLSHLKSYFGWAVGAGIIAVNPAEGVQPRSETREERNGRNARRAFTQNELITLFDSPLFTGCKSRSQRAEKGRHVYRDEKYWFWLLALLTGARTEEIAALPSTFVDLGGTLCFDFRHGTKTTAGARLVPVLPDLRRLGIEQWAADQARRGRGMVEGPNGSSDWSKWLNRYLDDIGLDDPAVVAYSLRHNFRQQLRDTKLNLEIINKVFGHEGEAVGDGYGRDLSPGEARRVATQVKSPIPLEHLFLFNEKNNAIPG